MQQTYQSHIDGADGEIAGYDPYNFDASEYTESIINNFPITSYADNYIYATESDHDVWLIEAASINEKISILPDLAAISLAPEFTLLQTETTTATSVYAIIKYSAIYKNSKYNYTYYSLEQLNTVRKQDSLAVAYAESKGWTAVESVLDYEEITTRYEKDQIINQRNTYVLDNFTQITGIETTTNTGLYIIDISSNYWDYNLIYPSSRWNQKDAGRYLITQGNPTGQREAAWGANWINVISDGSSTPEPEPPTPPESEIEGIPELAIWQPSEPDSSSFQSPIFIIKDGYYRIKNATEELISLLPLDDIKFYTGLAGEAFWNGISKSSKKVAIDFLETKIGPSVVTPANVAKIASILGNSHESIFKKLASGIGGITGDEPSDFNINSADSEFFDLFAGLSSKLLGDAGFSIGSQVFDAMKYARRGVLHSDISFFLEDAEIAGAYVAPSGHRVAILAADIGDSITGGDLDDLIMGRSGGDYLKGAGGNDNLLGGDGNDTAIYSGNATEYAMQIDRSNDSAMVTDLLPWRDGNDHLSKFERIEFADMTLNLKVRDLSETIPESSLNLIAELYVAFLNRIPDGDGMEFWIQQYKNNKSINDIAEEFYNAGVFFSALTGYSDDMTSDDFINIVYRNVLGRTEGADQDGLAFWRTELESGQSTKGTLVTSILDAAHGSTFSDPTNPYHWVQQLLDNKLDVAKQVAVQWGVNYKTSEEIIYKGLEIAAAVTPDDVLGAISLVGVSDIVFL